jgi:hypothetical protein
VDPDSAKLQTTVIVTEFSFPSRLKLNEQKVKLWEPPYYDPEKRIPNEASLHELGKVKSQPP